MSIHRVPKDWKCRPGRPHHTWLRTVEADLQPLNHGLISVWRHARDQRCWNQLVEMATLQSGACTWW